MVISSNYKGVCRHSNGRGWQAQIKVDGEKIYLGYHHEEKAAALAYNIAAREYYGQDCWVNDLGQE